MSKKLIFALIILFATISVYIFVKVTIVKKDRSFSTSIGKPLPTPISQTALSLLPNPLVITSGQASSVNVVVDNTTSITLAQIEIAYDPHMLFNVNIIPGDYFKDPVEVLKNIDTKNGRISYALKGDSGNPEAKTIAVVNFTSLTLSLQKETKLSFLPKTYLKSSKKDIALKDTKPSVIILKPSFYSKPATPTATLQ